MDEDGPYTTQILGWVGIVCTLGSTGEVVALISLITGLVEHSHKLAFCGLMGCVLCSAIMVSSFSLASMALDKNGE